MAEEDLDGDDELDEEVDVPDDIDEAELEELANDDVDVLDDDVLDDDVLDDDVLDDQTLEEPSDVDEGAVVVATPAVREDEDDEDDEDDEADADDVEASLDVILKERLVVAEDEAEEDEEPSDGEDRAESALKVLPKQPGEFVCQSCFLVKHPSQLADKDAMLCRDCI